MTIQIETLKLSLKLMFQGILPKRHSTLNYSKAKFALKKQFSYDFTVNQIDLIINFILIQRINTHAPKDPLEKVNPLSVGDISSPNIIDFKQEFEEVTMKKLTLTQVNELINTVSELMRLYNDAISNTNSTYSEQQYTYCRTDRYAATKSKLNAVLKRDLTKEEFHLFVEMWFHYMSLAQDASDPDNRFKEQLNELKADLIIAIDSIKSKISANKRIVSQIKSLERFPRYDLSVQENAQQEDQKQLSLLEKKLTELNQKNGHELNIHKLRQQAYFAIMFCAETFGVSAPKRSKDSNPLSAVLKIMLNINEEEKDIADISNSLSQFYQKYVCFKNSGEVKDIYEDLIRKARANPYCYVTLSSINRKFQTVLLDIKLQPSISINSDTPV